MMTTKVKCCNACDEPFEWDDDVIQVANDYYHKDCVTLYPTGYCAFLDEVYLGETENDDGDMACNLLSKDEYIDLDEQGEAE